MKTYIAFRKEDNGFKMVAIEANSSIKAYNSLKSMGFNLINRLLKLVLLVLIMFLAKK